MADDHAPAPMTVVEMGRKGGLARAKNLTRRQISQISKHAVRARERKRHARKKQQAVWTRQVQRKHPSWSADQVATEVQRRADRAAAK